MYSILFQNVGFRSVTVNCPNYPALPKVKPMAKIQSTYLSISNPLSYVVLLCLWLISLLLIVWELEIHYAFVENQRKFEPLKLV